MSTLSALANDFNLCFEWLFTKFPCIRSWTWLSSDRPYHNSSCSSVYDDWHYGIGGNISKVTKYARDDVKANKTAVVQRYLNRKVHMALGLLDYGAGDTHCQAGE